MSRHEPLTVTVTFEDEDAGLIRQACGIWTEEQYVRAASINTAISLVKNSTKAQRHGAVPVLPRYEASRRG